MRQLELIFKTTHMTDKMVFVFILCLCACILILHVCFCWSDQESQPVEGDAWRDLALDTHQ